MTGKSKGFLNVERAHDRILRRLNRKERRERRESRKEEGGLALAASSLLRPGKLAQLKPIRAFFLCVLCVLCGSFSSAIEGCSTEKSVEKVKTAGCGCMTEFLNKEKQQFLAADPSWILRLLCFLLLKRTVIG